MPTDTTSEHEAQLVSVDGLKPYPANPRRGNVQAIRESLQANGQYRPVVVRRETQEVLAGNHTLMAAKEEGWTDLWATFVSCDDEQAKRIVLVDNRSNDLAGYDSAALVELLQELPDLTGSGYDQEALDELVASTAVLPDGPPPDDAPAPPEEPETKPGDLYALGKHRLLCGDATSATDLEKLMGGGRR